MLLETGFSLRHGLHGKQTCFQTGLDFTCKVKSIFAASQRDAYRVAAAPGQADCSLEVALMKCIVMQIPDLRYAVVSIVHV